MIKLKCLSEAKQVTYMKSMVLLDVQKGKKKQILDKKDE